MTVALLVYTEFCIYIIPSLGVRFSILLSLIRRAGILCDRFSSALSITVVQIEMYLVIALLVLRVKGRMISVERSVILYGRICLTLEVCHF